MNDTRRSTGAPSTIGPYSIVGELGRGGMGTVYRARDNRLRRDVALKVLPGELRLSPIRLARFEQEARLVAALSHPNIAAIYGIEDSDPGVQALVLELVEGKTLATRIAEGRLGIDEALTIARQIAQALDAAHAKGIVHRDLKPANIVITPSGLVKVLDFGVAKMTDPAEAAPDETATAGFTREGGIVGTPAYMSPEQSRGQFVDQRTDLWSFGCVLYEMLTGQRPFEGETSSQTMAAVQTADLDWGRLPPQLSAVVTALLKRCLEREPAKRLADVAAIRFVLEDVTHTPGEHEVRARAGSRRARWLTRAVWLVGGALIGGAMFAIWAAREAPQQPSPRPAVSGVASQPTGAQPIRLTDFVGMEESPAISPDGKYVAFVRIINGQRQIWYRALTGTGGARQITMGAGDHQVPRWTPDSLSLIYFIPSRTPGAEGRLWEIPILGGPPQPVTTAIGGGDISHDGQRIAVFQIRGASGIGAPAPHVELAIVSRTGTPISSQPIPDSGQLGALRFSPDDKWIAFQRSTRAFLELVFVTELATNREKQLASAGYMQGFAWLPDGSGLVYASSEGSTVLYPPVFSLHVAGLDGTTRPLRFGDDSYTQPDISHSGDVVVIRTRMHSDIWKIPVEFSPRKNVEKAEPVTNQTGLAQAPSVNQDGTWVAYLSDSGGHGNVWIAKTDRTGAPRQVTFETNPAISIGVPVWAPVGNLIAYIVTKGGKTGISLVDAESGGPRPFVEDGIGANWSDDGRWLYYSVIRKSDSSPGVETQCIERIPVPKGPSEPVRSESVRCDGTLGSAIGKGGSTMYFVRYLGGAAGVIGTSILKAAPPSGTDVELDRVSATRIPVSPRQLVPVLSNLNTMLAFPLIDGQTANIWGLPTAGGPMRKLTEFGDRSVMIARRVAWAPDDKSIYAAVAEIETDVVRLDALLPSVSAATGAH